MVESSSSTTCSRRAAGIFTITLFPSAHYYFCSKATNDFYYFFFILSTFHFQLKPSGRESVRSGCSTSGSVPNLTLYHPPASSQRQARPNPVRHQTLPHVEKLSDSFPHLPQQAPIPHPRLHRKTQGQNAELGLKTDSVSLDFC